MYKFLLSCIIFITLLSANNPKPYAALGDVIYNDLIAIKSLKSVIPDTYKDDLNLYISEVEETKLMGYSLEKGDAKTNKRVYLNHLRKLSKSHDLFVRMAYRIYNDSIKHKNYSLFSQIINNSLINTKKNKEEIMDFYYKHSEFIDVSSGFIHSVLEEEERIKEEKRAKRKKYKSRKMLEAEKIKRIRKNDRLEQEKRESKLQAELLRKKLEIREKQKQELAQ